MVLIKLADVRYAINPLSIDRVVMADVGINFRVSIKCRDVKENIELRAASDTQALSMYGEILGMMDLAMSQRRRL
jgi:hypothetical protein